MKRYETMKDFKARIAAAARGNDPQQNGAYEAPQLDAATIMADLKAGIVRPAHNVRGAQPELVRAPNHRDGGATMVPRGGAALQIYQRQMWETDFQQPTERQNRMRSTNLILHAGASQVERAVVETVPTPEATRTWTPIPHTALIERVEDTIRGNGLEIVNQTHGLTRNGDRYFGLMQVANGHNSEDYAMVVGTRNSHDKSFPAGLVVGASVFVCDNLSFIGEVRMIRKHTPNILRDLPGLVQRMVGQLMEKWHAQDKRIEAYKNTELTDVAAHDMIVRSIDARALTATQVPNLLQEWRHPSHEEFAPRTAWSLFNGYTEVLKPLSLNELAIRTQRLHGLFDTQVGLHGLN